MKLVITGNAIAEAQALPFEVVERKGIGHPDSMADLIAEEFSHRYARFGMDNFGVVPNHWVDKVALIGAAADVGFGCYTIQKTITAYLFGKVTPKVGDAVIPIESMFTETVQDVLAAATRNTAILDHVRCVVENTAGVALDHPAGFYRPVNADDCVVIAADRRANDTSFCTAHAPCTPLEQLVIDVENFVNGDSFAGTFPMLGSDVKVMAARISDDVDMTICLPFHPEKVPSAAAYRQWLTQAEEVVREFATRRLIAWESRSRLSLAVNTKDQGSGAYLAPFGTSLGKGDCGLVGRGNKTNGVIPAVRCTGVEALAGKNPMHHTGKLYTVAATRIADRIFRELGLSCEVVLMARNGHLLSEPAFAGVRLSTGSTPRDQQTIADIIRETVSNLDDLSNWLLTTPSLDRFRQPALMAGV